MSNITKKESNNKKIGCALPCYKGGSITIELIKNLYDIVDFIVLVDDACPLKTGNCAEQIFLESKKLYVLYNESNKGVGFSVKRAFTF